MCLSERKVHHRRQKTMAAGAAWSSALRHALQTDSSSNDEEVREMTSNPSAAFTTSQLRQYIHHSYATLCSLQRQLYRGEESYFEESYAHGNLLSGWDNIWIDGNPAASDTNSGSSAGGDGVVPAQKVAAMRKMPNDYRWFSDSCGVSAKGDARVASILGRESLLEPPPSSVSLAKVSSKVGDSSPTKRSVSIKATVPMNKKSKLEESTQQPFDARKTPQRPGPEVILSSTASADKPQDVLSSPLMNMRAQVANNKDQCVATELKEVIDSDMELDCDEPSSSKDKPSDENLIHSTQPSTSAANNKEEKVDTTGKSEVEAGNVDDVSSSSVQARSEELPDRPNYSEHIVKADENLSSSVSVKMNDETLLPQPDDGTSEDKTTTAPMQGSSDTKLNAKLLIVAPSTESAQRASPSIEKVNKPQTSSNKPGNRGSNQIPPHEQSTDDSSMQQEIPKETKQTEITEKSESKPSPASDTAVTTDTKVEKAAETDSDEELTLSEIVKMKSKTNTDAKTPAGKRTSKRRRSPN